MAVDVQIVGKMISTDYCIGMARRIMVRMLSASWFVLELTRVGWLNNTQAWLTSYWPGELHIHHCPHISPVKVSLSDLVLNGVRVIPLIM